MATQFNFDEVKKKIQSLNIIKEVADMIASGFDDSFKEEGFDGAKWKEVNRRISGANFYKDRSAKTRPILQGLTGRLRRAVNNAAKNGYKVNNSTYVLVVDNSYASYHNYGTDKLPKRQFIGVSRATNKKVLDFITKKIENLWVI